MWLTSHYKVGISWTTGHLMLNHLDLGDLLLRIFSQLISLLFGVFTDTLLMLFHPAATSVSQHNVPKHQEQTIIYFSPIGSRRTSRWFSSWQWTLLILMGALSAAGWDWHLCSFLPLSWPWEMQQRSMGRSLFLELYCLLFSFFSWCWYSWKGCILWCCCCVFGVVLLPLLVLGVQDGSKKDK